MGNEPNNHSFIKEQWQLVQKNITHTVWRNRMHPKLHIEEHDKFSTDQYTYHNDKEIFQFRQNNPYLVAGAFLQQHEEHQFCSTNYKYRIFIEKIPIRLTDIEHIPFPDILHLYSQCLNGFQLLAQKLGYYFEVEQSYIGVNEWGLVKVWLSKYLSNSTSIGGKISQQQMVKSIIDIVDKNSDPYQLKQNIPIIRNYLYRNADVLKFSEAKRQLQSYIDTYNKGIVPSRLDCVEQAGGVYAIANRPELYQQQQYNIAQHSQPQIIPNSRIQVYNDPNRPQLISNTNISQPQYNSLTSYQNIDYKSNEAIPQPHLDQAIINPVQIRQNMQVVRRRKSDYEKQLLQYPSESTHNNMKYSQTLQQEIPIQSRHLNFTRNLSVNPPLQNNRHFNTVKDSQTFPTHLGIKEDPVVTRRSPILNFVDSTHQITFKNINKNVPPLPISRNPSIQISGAPSSNNFSPAPSLMNSHRANNSSHVYPTNQTRIINQNSVSASFVSPQVSINSRREATNSFQNSSSFGIIEPKGILKNQSLNFVANSLSKQVLPQDMKKEATFTPYIQESKAQIQTSFNPPYLVNSLPQQNQQSFQRQVVQEARPQTDSAAKKTNHINPDDGKSSQDFLKKLRQINSSFATTQNQRHNSKLPVQNSPVSYGNSYNNNRFYESGNGRGYEQIMKTPVERILQVENEQFGKTAVSNIIQSAEHSHKNISPFRNNEPLKFEKGLSLKYSMMDNDESEQFKFKKTTFGEKYQARIDTDLLADLSRLKK